jgi:hypothetical protein
LRSGLSLPVAASIAWMSPGVLGVDQVSVNRLPSSANSPTPPEPSGSVTLALGLSVVASRMRMSLWLPALTDTASELPRRATAIPVMSAVAGLVST